jgi:hypothetical protein
MSTYYLATVFPFLRRIRLPLTRDQFMLLLAAINELFLGIDTYIAHSTTGTIKPLEWIPIIFGPVAGILLLVAGLVALRRRMAANIMATLVFIASIIVGLLGSYFHLVRSVLPNAPAGQQVLLPLLAWGPPLLGPITFALVGILGMSAAWQEEIAGSGVLVLPGGKRLHMPYSKTKAYFFIVGIGTLITLVSSVLDHSHANFANPWTWIPTVAGIFATAVIFCLAIIDQPTHTDLLTYAATMILMAIVGMLGTALHISQNLIAQGTIVDERFLRGAPILAPLLFANMASLGLITLLDSSEKIDA